MNSTIGFGPIRKFLKKLPQAIRNRFELACQKIIGKRYDALVYSAYTQPNGHAHQLIQKHARIEFGLAQGNLKKAQRFFRNIWRAQVRFFENKTSLKMNTAALNFNGLHIHCKSDSCLESLVYLRGFYDELPVLEEYEKYAKHGSIAIDVGANIGVHTLVLSSCVGASGTVYAYEPREALCRDVKKNLELNNRLTNVVIRQIGVGEKRRSIPFRDHASNFNQGAGTYDPSSQSSIEIVALDEDLSEAAGPVSLIKMDVEGMEFNVILGAKKILRTWMPTLCVEYNSPPWNLPDFIREIPYPVEIFRIPNSRFEQMRKISPSEILEGLNNLLIRPSSK